MTRPIPFMRVALLGCLAAFTAIQVATSAVAEESGVAVAVLGFQNSTGASEYEPLQEGLAEMVAIHLSCADGAVVVDRQNVRRVLKEQALSLSQLADPATAVRAGQLTGADVVVMGGFARAGGAFKINAHAYDVGTAALRGSEEVSGEIGNVLDLTHALAAKLAPKLNVKMAALDPSRLDRSPVAGLHLMRGLGYFYGGLHDNAVGEFSRAAYLDPANAAARFWAAKCFYAEQEWGHAWIELNEFLRRFPDDAKATEAREMFAVCDEKLGVAVKGILEDLHAPGTGGRRIP